MKSVKLDVVSWFIFVSLLGWLPLVSTETEKEGPRFIAEVSGLLNLSGLPYPEGDTWGVCVGSGGSTNPHLGGPPSRQGFGQWLLGSQSMLGLPLAHFVSPSWKLWLLAEEPVFKSQLGTELKPSHSPDPGGETG